MSWVARARPQQLRTRCRQTQANCLIRQPANPRIPKNKYSMRGKVQTRKGTKSRMWLRRRWWWGWGVSICACNQMRQKISTNSLTRWQRWHHRITKKSQRNNYHWISIGLIMQYMVNPVDLAYMELAATWFSLEPWGVLCKKVAELPKHLKSREKL